MHYLPSVCSHFTSWFESDCHPNPLSLLFSRWQSSSSPAQLVVAVSPNRLTSWQPTESDLSTLFHQHSGTLDLISGREGRARGPTLPLHAAFSFPLYPPPPKCLCDEPSHVSYVGSFIHSGLSEGSGWPFHFEHTFYLLGDFQTMSWCVGEDTCLVDYPLTSWVFNIFSSYLMR